VHGLSRSGQFVFGRVNLFRREVRFDKPELLINAARYFGEQISSRGIPNIGRFLDGFDHGATKRRQHI
jgi:hypothetical protein